MVDTRKESARRLREARAAKYPSASAAARAMKIGISGYVHHENGRRAFSLEDARLYGHTFGVDLAFLLGISDDAGKPNGRPVTEPSVVVAALGAWREPVARAPHRLQKMPGSADIALRSGQYAVLVADDSVDNIIPKDSFAICESLRPPPLDGRRFHADAIVHVERRRSAFTETSIRRVVPLKDARDGARIWLCTDSKDSALAGHVTFPPTGKDESVRVLGLVVGIYRPIRP